MLCNTGQKSGAKCGCRAVYQLLVNRLSCCSIPGHALHEKGLQRQIGVGTLFSSQERRALAVPLINRGSTPDFVPPSVYIGFPLFLLPKRRPGQCLRFAGGQEGGLSPGRIDPTASRPTQPRLPSPPRRAPLRPDRHVVCLGFGFDRLVYIKSRLFVLQKSYLKQICSMPWKAGRQLFSGADCWIGWSGIAWHCCTPASPLCAVPPRPARGMSGLWHRQIFLFPKIEKMCFFP